MFTYDDGVFRRTDDNSIQMAIDGISGGPYIFQIAAPSGESWQVNVVNVAIASAVTGWENTAFGNIAGGLGKGLTLRHRKISTDKNLWKVSAKDNMELLSRFGTGMVYCLNGEEKMLVTSLDPKHATITITDDEVLQFVIEDDLSSLRNMRSYITIGK